MWLYIKKKTRKLSRRSFRSGLFSNFTLLVDPAFEFADVSVGGGREMGTGRYEKAEVHMRDLALFSLQFNHTDIVTSLSPWNPTKERNLLQRKKRNLSTRRGRWKVSLYCLTMTSLWRTVVRDTYTYDL